MGQHQPHQPHQPPTTNQHPTSYIQHQPPPPPPPRTSQVLIARSHPNTKHRKVWIKCPSRSCWHASNGTLHVEARKNSEGLRELVLAVRLNNDYIDENSSSTEC